jgi:macrolide transport system ATP-binding/permease protein
MRWLAWLTGGVVNLFRRSRLDRETRDELAFHLASRTRDLIESGLRPEAAARQARLEMGGVENYVERVHDARGFPLAEQFVQDLRHGGRLLAKHPGFTAVSVLSLGLGIGANSAVFSFADALLLRPLPVRAPGDVVSIGAVDNGQSFGARVSYLDYRDLRDLSRSFTGLVAHHLTSFGVARSSSATAEMKLGLVVSENFFSVLGVPMALGRGFIPEEGRVPGRDAVVVISHDLWRTSMGEDVNIIGSHLRINGSDFTVVGVTAPAFTSMEVALLRPALYVPMAIETRLTPSRAAVIDDRAAGSLVVHGRLKPGVSRAAATAELSTIWNGLVQRYPEANRSRAIAVRSLLQERILESPPVAVLVALLLALVAIVLVIACANVANLLLGRARARSREIAVRLALGVSRSRLLRQLFTESLVLAALGCGAGLMFAYGGVVFLQRFQITTDLPLIIAPRLDARVLGFSVLAASLSALLCGLVPAWQSLKTRVVPSLRSTELGTALRTRTTGRNVLVVAQVALSMTLLVAAGVLVDGFRKALQLDPGFRTTHLLRISTDTSIIGYSSDQTRLFYRRLIEGTQAVPGVASATLTSGVPLEGWGWARPVIPEGHRFPNGGRSEVVFSAAVDDHYFATMKVAVTRGRAFTVGDGRNAPGVAIVNEEFAKQYWPGQSPLGKRIRIDETGSPWLEIVGVTATGKYMFIGEGPRPFFYVPVEQVERPDLTMLVETAGVDAAPLLAPVRDLVRHLDAGLPVYDAVPFSTFYKQRALSLPLTITQMVGAMGLLGLTLAIIGLYGLVVYSVARRTKEIGIRMAIGAGSGDVLRMVLVQGLTLALVGIAFGSVASAGIARLLSAGLTGLGRPSLFTYAVVPPILIGLTLLASYVPARRAALIDPLLALRDE